MRVLRFSHQVELDKNDRPTMKGLHCKVYIDRLTLKGLIKGLHGKAYIERPTFEGHKLIGLYRQATL